MADVFSQVYVHIVFTPRNRQALIRPEWEVQLHKYITGIVQKRKNKLLAIGGMPDHVHIFIGLRPSESIADLVREIKKASNAFIKKTAYPNGLFRGKMAMGFFRTIIPVNNGCANISGAKRNTTGKRPSGKNMNN